MIEYILSLVGVLLDIILFVVALVVAAVMSYFFLTALAYGITRSVLQAIDNARVEKAHESKQRQHPDAPAN